MKIDFMKAAEEKFDMMRDIRREMHMHPEIDRKLDLTVSLIEAHLSKLNISYKRFPNNGIIAELGNKGLSNKTIALRADMDALEVIDMKEASYKSQVHGYMHACGHDAHTSILLGTAAILKGIEKDLKGSVRLIFQPAEETDGGAKEMIEYGALDGAHAILGLHVEETLDTGVIGVNKGLVHAASNPFVITVSGKGSHGASPQDGVDSIYIAAKIIDNLQGIISREIAAADSAVISIGKITGGTAPNAICSNVKMHGILRTLGGSLRGFAKERIRELVESTARMYRGSALVEFVEGYPSFRNNKKLVEWFSDNTADIEAIEMVELEKPSMGVEDFAYYAEEIPALFYKLGCRNESKGIIHPAHGSFFDIDEECLKYGAMLQSKSVFELLETDVI